MLNAARHRRTDGVGRFLMWCVWALVIMSAMASPMLASEPPSLAVLGVFFQNDNESLEPTSDAERARLARTEKEFLQQLAASGRYRIVGVPDGIRSKIAAAQTLGECGGCEIDFGRQLGANIVAWIRVQKVSNLILNMNVYMVDVARKKPLVVRSVKWTPSLGPVPAVS